MTITLKDGSRVEDPRLGRLTQFDERSRSYGVVRTLTPEQQRKPRSWTWTCDVWLDQKSEGACFPEDTLIRLSNGSHVPINEVRLLDEVVTAEGRTGAVTQLMVRRADKGLLKVVLSGHTDLRCTPEHPVLTKRGYVAAEDLLTGDFVAITRFHSNTQDFLDCDALVDIRDFRGVISGEVNSGGVVTKVSPLPSFLSKTPSFGRLVGLYAAEGYTTANKVVWCYGGHERDTLVEETVNLIKSVFDAEARIQVRPNGTINVVLYGKAWRRLFASLVPGTSKHGDKRLSMHVTDGSQEYLRGVLEGWMDGDGHDRRNTREGTSVCRNLALGMHSIATALGMKASIRKTKGKPNRWAATRQDPYHVLIGLVGGNNSAEQNDSAVWRKVKSIETEDFEGWVYNLEVEGDHSYVADGVGVHNCSGFAFSHEKAARPISVPNVTEQSARELYWAAQRIDPWEGGAYENANPFYEGTSVLSTVKVAQGEGFYGSYSWAFGEEQLFLSVGWKGPAVLGIPWFDSMYNTDSKGFIRPEGKVVGGHAILCNGVSVRGGYYRLHNSWNKSYGIGGDCFITRQNMAILLAMEGECLVPENRSLGL